MSELRIPALSKLILQLKWSKPQILKFKLETEFQTIPPKKENNGCEGKKLSEKKILRAPFWIHQ